MPRRTQHKLHGSFKLPLLEQKSFPGLDYKPLVELNIELNSCFISFTKNGKLSVPKTDINESHKH